MTSLIGKYVARRFFKETVNNAFGTEDPYFEEIGNKKKKSKKRRRPPPPGLSKNDTKVLTKVKRRAYYLDMSLGICCCGIGIGWSAVIGFIPAIGDVIALYLSYSVLRAASQIDGGLPNWLYSKMLANVICDFAIGLVPFVGDVVDVLYKANSRNALLLEKYLRERGAANLAKSDTPNPQPVTSSPVHSPGTPVQSKLGKTSEPEGKSSGGWFRWSGSNPNQGTEMGVMSPQTGKDTRL